MSALDAAKMESARRQLYSGFLKGAAMGASIVEEKIVVVVRTKGETKVSSEEDVEMEAVEVIPTKKVKRRTKQDGADVTVEITVSKEERRAAKLLRKAERSSTHASSIASTSTLATPAEAESDVSLPSLPKKSKKSKSSKNIVESVPASPRTPLTIEERATLEEEEYQSALRAAKVARKEAKREAKASRSGTETIEVESKKKRKRDKSATA